jgi:hypothetical protein
MKRPDRKDYPQDNEMYILMLNTYVDAVEEDLENAIRSESEADWALERYQQTERDNFGNEWK